MDDRRRRISLVPDPANLSVLEKFIARCEFLDPNERQRATLVTAEFFDNIAVHSRRFRFETGSAGVAVTVSKMKRVTIRIRYRTANFAEIIRANRTVHPHFDAGSCRYRGLGLRMCRNLSLSIRFRQGLFKSSIIIIL